MSYRLGSKRTHPAQTSRPRKAHVRRIPFYGGGRASRSRRSNQLKMNAAIDALLIAQLPLWRRIVLTLRWHVAKLFALLGGLLGWFR